MIQQIWEKGFGRALSFTVFLALAAGASGQTVSAQGIANQARLTSGMHDLALAETVTFPSPPPTALIPEIKCDSNANIYVVQTGSPPNLLFSNGLSAVPISKLSMASKSSVSYPVPSLDRYRGVIRSHFDVSADGHLYALLEALDASPTESEPPPSFFIAKYKDDGSLDKYFKLEDAPNRHIQPFRFVMFRDGNVLVTGTAVEKGKPLRPFIAVMDDAGRFVTYVKASVPEPVAVISGDRILNGKDQAVPATPPGGESTDPESDIAVSLSSSSFMVSASDGNVYLLRGEARPRLYVISPGARVIRDFEIHEPASGLKALNMGMVGGDKVYIAFGRVEDGSPHGADSNGTGNLISVVSPYTGQAIAVYRLPSDADPFNVPACAPSSDNFLFIGSTEDSQHLQIRKYTPK